MEWGFTSRRNKWRDEKAKFQSPPIGVLGDGGRRESCHLLAWMALGCSLMHVSRKLVKEKAKWLSECLENVGEKDKVGGEQR